MDPSAVKNLIEQMIPFVKKTGVLVDELSAERVRLKLPHDPTNLNPMGILHAGATFTLAETTAAALCVMALGTSVSVIAKSVEIRFRRPGKGEVFARAAVPAAEAERIRAAAAQQGKLDQPIAVEVSDASGQVIAEVSVTMSVRTLG